MAVLACLVPWALWAVFHIPIGSADTHLWLPQGRAERQRYEDFLDKFGSDQLLLASWDGATLDDPRVVRFIELAENEVAKNERLTSVVSPIKIVESLENSQLELSRAEAVNRLQGTLIGKSGTLSIVILVSQLGGTEHKQTIELVRKIADEVPDLGRDKLRLVGSVYESYAIDKAAEDSLSKLVLPSSFLALLVSWFCVKSFRAVFVVMILAGCGQLVVISVVYYGGYEFSAVMIVLPTLVFMLTLSGAVHLVNYLLDAKKHDAQATGLTALAKGWLPCTLSSVTTMLGMLSLVGSELLPVRQFGYLSAICLGIATVILLLGFPALADFLFSIRNPLRKPSASPLTTIDSESSSNSTTSYWLAMQYRYRNWISIGAILALAISFVGVSRLTPSSKFLDMFPPENRVHQDLVWFEENVGPVATVEVLLSYKKSDDSNVLDQAQQVVKVSQELKGSGQLGGSMSAANFFPKFTNATGIRATSIRASQKRGLEANLDQLAEKGVLSQSTSETTWRISVRVPAASSSGYGQVTEYVAGLVESSLKDAQPAPTVELTGLYPVLHETQMTLLSDLGYSFLSAYLLISPVMMLVVRGFWGGLLIMIPNILPLALAFGVLGWFGNSLEIAGVLTASIALGIAVDDTLHFVCWYMNERKAANTPREAVARSFRSCSSAMLHTTLICSCSMFPFLFADFIPTRQFATLMISILVAAIVADLVVLPALLLSPAGILIRSEKGSSEVARKANK